MKTTHKVTTDGLRADDFITYHEVEYKVFNNVLSDDLLPGGMYNVWLITKEGLEVHEKIWGSTWHTVTRDDGLSEPPTHVVVDRLDGYTFYRDINDGPFTSRTAIAFAEARNAASKRPTYEVYSLIKVNY